MKLTLVEMSAELLDADLAGLSVEQGEVLQDLISTMVIAALSSLLTGGMHAPAGGWTRQ